MLSTRSIAIHFLALRVDLYWYGALYFYRKSSVGRFFGTMMNMDLLQKKINWKIVCVLCVALVLMLSAVIFFWFLNKPSQLKNISSERKQTKSEQQIISDDQLKEKIGQMIMVGFRGTKVSEKSDIYNEIKDVKIGGVVLFDYDTPTKSYPRNIVSPEQTKNLISDLQKYSETPLFVAIDAEGGAVNRLKKEYGFSIIASAQKMGQDKTLNTVRAESKKLAAELKTAGFNMNLAPVVDVNVNPKNPIIGAVERSFSSNPEEVFNQSKVFIKNHLLDNIITVEKHFPGQGSATTDSHKTAVDVTNTYKEDELIPYKKLNDEGLLDVVMVAHVINKNIDENYPATMSSAFIQNILRKQIRFGGVVMSDDMQMAAITENYSFEDAIIKSINAGTDIISFLNNSPNGYDEKIAYKVRDVIFNAVKDKKIDEKRIEDSYSRIINLKKKFEIIAPALNETKLEKTDTLK